ncbi:MAG: hypothetical protein ACRDPC_05895 [Solirubrobacteraceae bacterium]
MRPALEQGEREVQRRGRLDGDGVKLARELALGHRRIPYRQLVLKRPVWR